MTITQIRAGGDRNFSYILTDEETREAAVIDPGMSPDEEADFLRTHNLRLIYIIATHDHFDHTGGMIYLKKLTGAQTAMHALARSPHDICLRDGDQLTLGASKLTVIHTPGHTIDSICILAGKDLVTGDTLFVGKVGGTGYGSDARAEYESLHKKLMTLSPDTRVWPGHDYGVRPSSTIGHELMENPFILRNSYESFLELKRNWLEYKRIHGIK